MPALPSASVIATPSPPSPPPVRRIRPQDRVPDEAGRGGGGEHGEPGGQGPTGPALAGDDRTAGQQQEGGCAGGPGEGDVVAEDANDVQDDGQRQRRP